MFALHIISSLFNVHTVLGGDAETQNTSTLDTIRNHRNDTGFLSTAIAPPWVATPNTRGTGDILFTCLLTMVACIYTAVHPRIPPREGRPLRGSLWKTLCHKFALLKEKIEMCLDSLLAPEIALTAAVREWKLAKALQKDLKKKIQERSEEGKTTPNEITMKFCFFAVMGGFRVSIKDIRPSESAYFRFSYNGALPEDLDLSPDGIRLLTQLRHLDLLLSQASDAEDKNESSGFQKLLVMMQLFGMVLQCIVRKTHKLPISLLEIHTFVHATSAVLMYIAWFSKPADVSRPVYIPTDTFADAVALMVQEQFCEAQNIMTCLYPQRTPENESSMLAVRADFMPHVDESWSPSFRHFKNSKGELNKVTWIEITDTFPEVCVNGDEADGVALPCGMSYAKMFRLPVGYTGLPSFQRARAVRCMTFARRRIFFSPADKVRAARVIKHIALLEGSSIQSPEPYVNCEKVDPNQRRCRYPEDLYRTAFYYNTRIETLIPPERPPNCDPETIATYEHDQDAIESDFKMDNNRRLVPLTKSMVLNITQYMRGGSASEGRNRGSIFDMFLPPIFFPMNGGIHLAAWNSIFPTQIEGILWKVSSLIMASPLPAWNMYLLLGEFLARAGSMAAKTTGRSGAIEMEMGVESGQLHFPSHGTKMLWYFTRAYQQVGKVLCLAMSVAFVAARVYLIAESFISLRHMPYGVFVIPSWLEVLPHL